MRIRWMIIVVLVLLGIVFQVSAQSEDRELPVPGNLSRSGAATLPTFVVDNSGSFHLIWEDSFAGFMYTTGDGETWSEPTPALLPFTEGAFSKPLTDAFEGFYAPVLVTSVTALLEVDTEDEAEPEELIHAFWMGEDFVLQYSRARIDEIATGRDGWTASIRLAETAVYIAATADDNGRIHLTYIQATDSEEFPAGLYYRRSEDDGNTWSEPMLLYESSYFRNATEFNTHAKISASAESDLYVVWDNRALDSVYMMRSSDGGETWTEPTVVDQREIEDPLDGAAPSNIDLAIIDEDEIHLSWWAGDEEDALTCLLFHQWSENGGANWTEPEIVFEDSHDCPIDSHLIVGDNDLLFLLTLIRDEAYMQAWDREVWTEPDRQESLGTFQDPETFREILLECNQPAVTADNDLYVVGCGSGNDRDIWGVKRPLGNLTDWFGSEEEESVWVAPVSLVNSSVQLLPSNMVAGADGRLHMFWSESNSDVAFSRIEQSTSGVDADIYYSRLNAGAWAAPRPIVQSPLGKADQIASASGRRDSLFVVWSSGKDGGIYFSRAVADRASSETEWIDPVLLPAPQPTGSWPDIVVDENGNINVAYTIQLNEDRGIYLVRSTDNGDTWSEPILLFDGLVNRWQKVGRPHLGITLDGHMHMTWTRDVPDSSSTLALVYARSEDNGRSWTDPEIVTEETSVWSDIVGIGDRSVHRVWLGLSDTRNLLWHQVSFDNGLSWSEPNRVSDPATESGPSALIVDANRTAHLVQLAETNEAELLLNEWIWDGERWQQGVPLDLGLRAVGADALTAVQDPNGRLGILYSTLLINPVDNKLEDYLLYTSRQLEETGFEPTRLPTLTPPPLPSPTGTPLPAATATATVTLPQVNNNPEAGISVGPIDSNTQAGGILLGVLPALILVVSIVGVGFWFIRRK